MDVAVEFDLGTVELEGGDGGVGVTATTLRKRMVRWLFLCKGSFELYGGKKRW